MRKVVPPSAEVTQTKLTSRALGKVDRAHPSPATLSDWAKAASTSDDSPDDVEQERMDEPTSDDTLARWRSTLLSGAVKARVEVLTSELLPLASKPDLEPAQAQDIVRLLLLTLPRYEDQLSRQAVLSVLCQLLSHPPPSDSSASKPNGAAPKKTLAASLTKYLDGEVAALDKVGAVAPATRFALLGWAAAVYDAACKQGEGVEGAGSVLAALVDRLLDEEVKPSLRRSVEVIARRAVRQNYTHIGSLVSALTSATTTPPFRYAPFLGLVADVTLRLKDPKGKKDVAATTLNTIQGSLQTYWEKKVLAASVVQPKKVLTAFEDFHAKTLDQTSVLALGPAITSAFSRAALPTLLAVSSLPTALLPPLFPSVVPLLLTASKSPLPDLRAIAVALFATFFSTGEVSEDLVLSTFSAISTPLLGGTTSSPTHRATLLHFLSLLPPSCPTPIPLAVSLLSKESNEAVHQSLMLLLTSHLPHLLLSSTPLPSKETQALLKALLEPKPIPRRALHLTVGRVLWNTFRGSKPTESAKGFVAGLLGAFEGALKTVSTNPLNAPAGALEGFIAFSVLKGICSSWGVQAIDDAIAKNPVLGAPLVAGGAKPTFLLWDKVWRKNTAVVDDEWVLHALEVISDDAERLGKDASIRSAVGAGLVHVGVESLHFESRRAVGALLLALNARQPKVTHQTFVEGIRTWLLQTEKEKPKPLKAGDDETAPPDFASRIRPLLHVLCTFDTSTPAPLVRTLLGDLLVIAHHPRVAVGQLWVELVQRAGQVPDKLIEEDVAELLDRVWEDAGTTSASPLFAQAAYRAATTLAFISPVLVVPRLFKQLEDDLSTERLAFIGPTEYGVWATPEGHTFVDVLTATKPKAPTSHKNSKEREIEIWEEELRTALARKKPVAATLSKTDRILFEKQLAKEAEIRRMMADALGRLRRGFELCLCLVKSGAEGVTEYLATLVKDVLDVVVLRPATLVAPEAFGTYQSLGEICSPRLGQSKVALGVAVLRGVDAPVVPAAYTAESLSALVTRVLYRLRFLADQAPFDAGTYAYAAPLISRVVRSGGIGLDSGDQESSLEQVSLALDFIAFHCREVSDVAFPRLTMIGDLLATLISYPSLSRTATAAVADLAEAMKNTATTAEISALLEGAMTEEAYVRLACLQALSPLDLTEFEFPANLWVSCHDVDERNAMLAHEAWEENGLDVPESFLPQLVTFLSHAANSIRKAAAQSISEGIDIHPAEVALAIQLLIAEYQEKVKEIVPQYDQYGMVIEESLTVEDPWRTRVAIATTFKLISRHFAPQDVETFFDLLISGEALGDRSQAVRSEMLEAAIAAIDFHGKETLQTLIVTFETYLAQPSSGQVQDYITEALIILFGRLARHLDPSDPRIASVIERLVEALRTPSEVVQAAVCDCLPPLVRVIKDDVPRLVDQLMADLFQAPKYAERRGAAYGLAGVVRGRGISALKEFGVLGRLRDNAEDKKDVHARQGAVFGYEVLATVLGRLFEPYVPEILPLLLASFGDSSTEVRSATQDAAKAIMSKLSGHAVKLILPTLLAGLDDKQWRAKKGAIELMGAMAFLAPRQLSVSLPTIIPRLTEVLTDTHKQVRESANSSLKRFGEVVTNPEIQAMQSILLEALVDPSRKTPKALDALLATTFHHVIDSSSLALIIPLLDRGLRERSADVKRKASAIVGNMATLTEAKDLVPYLPQLIPLLRGVLIDPVPEARSTAAKSMGGLVERLGEQNFPDLIDTLMNVLKSPSSGVDQQGAAQGVSEILAGLGTDRLEMLLPTILASTKSPRAYVREGHISLLIFLPATFGDRFSPYLGRIIQPVLSGLADDSDFVREASMRAGRMIVANHSTKAIDLLLPELELGLFDPSWRIRQSSVQLVGDLLFRISGVSGKPDEDDDLDEDREDHDPGTESSRKALVDTLGKERRDRVLSALYIVRQDPVGVVRQAALHVWKALVQNTPRTVREMLSILMQIIVRTLAAPGVEQRETAARCLADTCRKLGEAVLGEVIGILQKAMTSSDRRQREGVCLALTEIMANATHSSLEAHESAVIAVVRGALVDSDPSVRSAAAQSFDIAQQVIGARSIDETIPTLLDALQQPGETANAALEALKEVMAVRAEKIFPVLIPRLIATPITAFNARALASLVRVAGPALGRRLTNIVDALQKAVKTEKDEDTLNDIDEALTAVLASVEDHESGLGSLQMHMLGLAKSEAPDKRVTGCFLFMRFCQATETDFSDYATDWIRQLVSLFDDRAPEVVGAAWMALDAFVKKTEKEDMESFVVPLRRTIENTGTPGVPVDGFSRPNGLKPILPILLQGLLAGTGEQREQAAYALGDLVERTSPEAFKSYCIQTVGPLIRVIGDRFPAPVKSAILSTLTIFLTRVPQYVKPFFPQLQRTFVKALSDAGSLSVRNRGIAALGVLMLHQPRVDPLITELTNLASTEDGDVRDSVVGGLASVILSGGKNMNETSKSAVLDLLSEAFAETNKEPYNAAIAKTVAAVALHDPSSISSLAENYLVGDLPSTQLSSLALREILDQAPQAFYDLEMQNDVVDRVLKNCAGTSPPSIARPAREAKELLHSRKPWSEDDEVQSKL